jgi:hypothetical protein
MLHFGERLHKAVLLRLLGGLQRVGAGGGRRRALRMFG